MKKGNPRVAFPVAFEPAAEHTPRRVRSRLLLRHQFHATILEAAFVGFVIGSLLAIVVGSLVGLVVAAERYLEPTFQALRAVPSLAWVPLMVIWFGIGETSKIVLIAKSAFFPV